MSGQIDFAEITKITQMFSAEKHQTFKRFFFFKQLEELASN